MVKKNFLKHSLVLLACFISGAFIPVNATHIRGTDITYQHITGNEYLVKVRLYVDCAGIAAPSNIKVCYSSFTIGFVDSINLFPSSIPVILPPNPYIAPVVSSCIGGTGLGIRRYEYSGALVLPSVSDDWKLSYTSPTNFGSGTIMNPIDYGIYVSTRIDNLNYPDNSSVQFLFDPTFTFCINQPAWDNLAASDLDGDYIQYSLVPSLTDTFLCPAQPFFPSTPTILSPPSSSTLMFVHPNDGYFHFTPSLLEIAHISVKASEFRNSQLINETVLTQMIMIITFCIISDLPQLNSSDVHLFPNPSHDILTVQLNNNFKNPDFHIYNSLGSQVQYSISNKGNLSEWKFEINGLVPGIYYLKVVDQESTYTKRFVKI